MILLLQLEDSIDGVTHAFRSKEFELREGDHKCNFRCIKYEKAIKDFSQD